MGDTYVMWTIVVVFVVLGAFMPLVNYMIYGSITSSNPEELQNSLSQQNKGTIISTLGFSMLFNIFTMFFWTFGVIPTIIDLIVFIPLRIILGYLILRAVRGI